MGDDMRIRCNSCGAEYRVADEKVAGRTVRVRCRACENPIHLAAPTVAPSAAPTLAPSVAPSVASRMEGSGLIDIRAMAVVLGDGRPAPGPADEVAFSAQPSFPAALPTAGVIMPVMRSDRPWWLVPSLALGGVLLVTVVALLAVLLLQPTTSSQPNAGDPLPGAAASNGKAPAGPVAAPGAAASLTERVGLTAGDPVVDPKGAAPMGAAPTDPGEQRSPVIRTPKRRPTPTARPRTRRPRKNPKVVRRPRPDPPSPSVVPRHRPRTISEILVNVATAKKGTLRKKPQVSLPARLAFRDIQRGMAGRLGVARACGRRYSTTGRVSVRLVVAGATGRVRSVTPKGVHAGSPTGRCVAQALRAAKFKPFSRSSQSFYFTVILR